MSQTIFVLEDDADIARLMQHNLQAAGFDVRLFSTPTNLIPEAERKTPSLFLLDIMVPGGDGLDVCRRLRNHNGLSTVPIIFATARAGENDRVLGLELGADDYITKPFSTRELVARVKAVLRRTSSKAEEKDELSFDHLTINLVKHEVRLKGDEVDLKPKEFDLLKLLCTNPGKVFTRDYLLEQLWGYDYLGDTRTVDVHMRRLRQKIEEDPASPRYLKTVHGIGYKFQYEEKE